jgi:hypothetical protein
MKKSYLIIFAGLIILISQPLIGRANNLANQLAGKILLQVEQNGEAWYVSPETNKRSFLGRPDDAFSIMREQGIGITNSDLDKIPVSFDYFSGEDSSGDGLPDAFKVALGLNVNSTDSDGDGYDDYTELLHGYDPLGPGRLNHDLNFAKAQAGRILLQVERNGEAWYVNPENHKRYFLGHPNDAFSIMRNLGLGISDENLAKIDKTEMNEQFVTKIIDFYDPITGDELPSVTIKTSPKIASELQVAIISMPSVVDSLIESGYHDSHPKMRVIGPFYQITPQGEPFGGVIDFSFCYFDADIRGYDENLFYIGKETSDVWENIGGTSMPDKNCVDISLTHAPEYTFAVYAGIE